MGWGARFAGVLVAGAVLSGVGGCGGAGPEGQALPVASSVPTAEPFAERFDAPSATSPAKTSPSPSASAGAMPAVASERTAVGVQAFARHFLEVVNQAFATGDIDDLEFLSSASCKTCRNWVDNIKQVYGDGGHIEGGQLEILSSAAADPEGADAVSVDVDTRVSKQIDKDARGKVLEEYPKETGRLMLSLSWVDAAWQVTEIKFGGLQ